MQIAAKKSKILQILGARCIPSMILLYIILGAIYKVDLADADSSLLKRINHNFPSDSHTPSLQQQDTISVLDPQLSSHY